MISARDLEIKRAIVAGLMRKDAVVEDDMADIILQNIKEAEKSEFEAALEIAEKLRLRVKRGGIDTYPSQENVEVREEDGHRYIHVRSVQPAGVVVLHLYEALLGSVMAGYALCNPQPDVVRTVRARNSL